MQAYVQLYRYAVAKRVDRAKQQRTFGHFLYVQRLAMRWISAVPCPALSPRKCERVPAPELDTVRRKGLGGTMRDVNLSARQNGFLGPSVGRWKSHRNG